MIKKTIKAHPIIILSLIKPYIFVLILPIARVIVRIFMLGDINQTFTIEIVFLALVIVLAIISWLSIEVKVFEGHLVIKKGALIKKHSIIQLSRISSISLKQNVFDLIFKSATCEINTEAGKPRKSDFNIKLSIIDAKYLYNIVNGFEKKEIIKFSTLRIALLAATVSSAATGIVIGIPVISKASNLVGVAISDMLFNEINSVSYKFNTIFPPIVNIVTIILLIAYGISFIISFVKHINFRLKIANKSIEIRSGMIVKRKTVFKRSRINNICFEQTPLMRVIKKYFMRVSVGGYGKSRGEKSIIIPIARHFELKQRLKTHFPFFETNQKTIHPKQDKFTLKRFLCIPILLMFIIFAISIFLMITFALFYRIILFLTIIAEVITIYYVSICYHNCKFGQIQIDEHVFVSGSKGCLVRELYCNKNNIGVIKIMQTPSDRRYKTCKIKIVVRSETADSVKVKNLNTQQIKKEIKKAFKINLKE